MGGWTSWLKILVVEYWRSKPEGLGLILSTMGAGWGGIPVFSKQTSILVPEVLRFCELLT